MTVFDLHKELAQLSTHNLKKVAASVSASNGGDTASQKDLEPAASTKPDWFQNVQSVRRVAALNLRKEELENKIAATEQKYF